MESANNQETENHRRYLRAKKRTDELKKFYKHLFIYIIVNVLISGIKITQYMEDGDSFVEALVNFDTLVVWIIWGVFVLLQAIKTFKSNYILGSDWEERKIREYMNESN